MSTIEQRLLSVAAVSSGFNAQRGMAVGATIITDWNMALEAMRVVAALLIFINDTAEDAYRFYDMDDPLGVFLETCLIHTDKAQIKAAIAAMEDHSPSRDEAMVEDKRYERDEIFKK